jgi:hypothetical protein
MAAEGADVNVIEKEGLPRLPGANVAARDDENPGGVPATPLHQRFEGPIGSYPKRRGSATGGGLGGDRGWSEPLGAGQLRAGAGGGKGRTQRMAARQERGVAPLVINDGGAEAAGYGEVGTTRDGFGPPNAVCEDFSVANLLQLLPAGLTDELRVDGVGEDGCTLRGKGSERPLGPGRESGANLSVAGGAAETGDRTTPCPRERGSKFGGIGSSQLADVNPAAPRDDLAAKLAVVVRRGKKRHTGVPIDENPPGGANGNELPLGPSKGGDVQLRDGLVLRIDAALNQYETVAAEEKERPEGPRPGRHRERHRARAPGDAHVEETIGRGVGGAARGKELVQQSGKDIGEVYQLRNSPEPPLAVPAAGAGGGNDGGAGDLNESVPGIAGDVIGDDGQLVPAALRAARQDQSTPAAGAAARGMTTEPERDLGKKGRQQAVPGLRDPRQ